MRPILATAARLATLLVLAAAPSMAEPRPYRLVPQESSVGFETDFGQDRIQGTFPVIAADLLLDLEVPGQSRVNVTLDVAGAEASFPFATQAMTGPKVLDAAAFPQMIFESTKITAEGGEKARVDGNLTLRGVTRPLTLQARLFRPPGSDPDDLSHLTLQLTGALLRSDYGATGWADMVGDEVRLVITAAVAEGG